jgi:hypothetical protein
LSVGLDISVHSSRESWADDGELAVGQRDINSIVPGNRLKMYRVKVRHRVRENSKIMGLVILSSEEDGRIGEDTG